MNKNSFFLHADRKVYLDDLNFILNATSTVWQDLCRNTRLNSFIYDLPRLTNFRLEIILDASRCIFKPNIIKETISSQDIKVLKKIMSKYNEKYIVVFLN